MQQNATQESESHRMSPRQVRTTELLLSGHSLNSAAEEAVGGGDPMDDLLPHG